MNRDQKIKEAHEILDKLESWVDQIISISASSGDNNG